MRQLQPRGRCAPRTLKHAAAPRHRLRAPPDRRRAHRLRLPRPPPQSRRGRRDRVQLPRRAPRLRRRRGGVQGQGRLDGALRDGVLARLAQGGGRRHRARLRPPRSREGADGAPLGGRSQSNGDGARPARARRRPPRKDLLGRTAEFAWENGHAAVAAFLEGSAPPPPPKPTPATAQPGAGAPRALPAPASPTPAAAPPRSVAKLSLAATPRAVRSARRRRSPDVEDWSRLEPTPRPASSIAGLSALLHRATWAQAGGGGGVVRGGGRRQRRGDPGGGRGRRLADALEPLPPIKRKQLLQKLSEGGRSASPPLPSPARSSG